MSNSQESEKSDDIVASTASQMVVAVASELYKDGLKPAVTEVGKGLEIVAKTVNLALRPLGELFGVIIR
ncbi:hypothetical protein D3C81_2021470 [compost metagenome]